MDPVVVETPRQVHLQVRAPRWIPRSALALFTLLACATAVWAQGAPEPGGLIDGKWAWEPSKRIRLFTPVQVLELVFSTVEGRPILIDARGPAEFAKGHIPGAINVPHKETWGRAESLRKYDAVGIVYYGNVDTRGEVGSKGLRSEGFLRVGRLVGGFRAWRNAGYPVAR